MEPNQPPLSGHPAHTNDIHICGKPTITASITIIVSTEWISIGLVDGSSSVRRRKKTDDRRLNSGRFSAGKERKARRKNISSKGTKMVIMYIRLHGPHDVIMELLLLYGCQSTATITAKMLVIPYHKWVPLPRFPVSREFD